MESEGHAATSEPRERALWRRALERARESHVTGKLAARYVWDERDVSYEALGEVFSSDEHRWQRAYEEALECFSHMPHCVRPEGCLCREDTILMVRAFQISRKLLGASMMELVNLSCDRLRDFVRGLS